MHQSQLPRHFVGAATTGGRRMLVPPWPLIDHHGNVESILGASCGCARFRQGDFFSFARGLARGLATSDPLLGPPSARLLQAPSRPRFGNIRFASRWLQPNDTSRQAFSVLLLRLFRRIVSPKDLDRCQIELSLPSLCFRDEAFETILQI
jgi:hypothetical protein